MSRKRKKSRPQRSGSARRTKSGVAARHGKSAPSGSTAPSTQPKHTTTSVADPDIPGRSRNDADHPLPRRDRAVSTRPSPADAAPPASATVSCAEELAEQPYAIAATYRGEATGEDISLRIAVRAENARDPRRLQERTVSVPALPVGAGPFAFTHRITGVPAGRWDVTIDRHGRGALRERPQRAVVATRLTFAAYGPAVAAWSWPALVAAGAVMALAVQGWLLARAGVNVATGLGVSVIACLVGGVGARVWYLVSHRQNLRRFIRAGACIQGFLLSAVLVLAIGGTLTGIGGGRLLDAATPGLFLGMALGRPGCFFTGCCAGRPTVSRWGLWSSDRVVAVRRIPVQLWEAVVALLIGVATLAMMLSDPPSPAGATFVGAIATYTAVRQVLFPFRAQTHTPQGRHLTLAICLAAIAAVVAVIAL